MKKFSSLLFLLFALNGFSQNPLLEKGQQYLQMGRNDLALEVLLQAEENLANTNDLTAAQCYNDIGVAYFNNGNDEVAQDYLSKGLSIRERELDDNNPTLADSYINLGLLYVESNFLQSIINLEKALEIYKEAYGDNHAKVALCYTNMSFAHRFQKNYIDALAYLDQTMKIWESTISGDDSRKAIVLSNKAIIYLQQENFEEALSLANEALDQYINLYGSKHPEVANTYALIGSAQLGQEQYESAVISFQKSIYTNLFDQEFTTIYDLPELQDYYNSEYLLSSLQLKAQALEALHFGKTLKPRDIESALSTYLKCDDLIRQIRQARLTEKDKIRIGNIASEVYDNGIRISLYLADNTFKKTKYQNIAFTFCERSKSSTLLEAINETKAKSFAGIPDHLIALEDSLKAEISWLEKEVAKGDDDSEGDRERLFEYQQSYRRYISQLEEDYPSYFNLKYQENDLSVSQIQNSLPKETLLLSYFIGSESIYIFSISNKDFDVYDKPKEGFFNRWTSGLRNSIKYDVPAGFDQSARSLYNQLIPEIGRGINHLIILPDGVLGTIPFETLLTEEPTPTSYHYLIEDYSISYDYAASLFLEKIAAQNQNQVSGIFLSAPVSFEDNEVRMPALPGTEEEVEQIRSIFDSQNDKPTVYLQKEASEAALKGDKFKDFKYIHFATHGIVNESKPELSRIFLSPTETEDGSLYSGEIYNLTINADLVTLSACETGLGKVEKGEGIIGLSRSLTYAGAKNLIVSLWQVADESTAKLMIDFYSEHLTNSSSQSFAKDLRQAKLKFISSTEYQNPYYWAPFILIGK